jgi:hypothetical protein
MFSLTTIFPMSVSPFVVLLDTVDDAWQPAIPVDVHVRNSG